MKTFRNNPSWTHYRDILAREFDVRFPCEPTEHWRLIRGHSIRYDHWLAEGEPRGTVILVHGGGGSGRILSPAALPALEAGWQVLAPDLPGYGLTEPSPDFDWDYNEWPSVIAEIADDAQGPVVLMGMSLGGLTAVFAAQEARRVAGIIATTLVDPSDAATLDRVARWPWLGRLSRLGMAVAPWLSDRVWMPLAFATPLRAMTSSPALQRYFQTDPLLGARWIPARFFRTIHQRRLETPQLHCPLALIHPGSDDWTPTALSMPIFERLETDKTFVELSNGTHLPLEDPAFREMGEAMKAFLRDVAARHDSTRTA